MEQNDECIRFSLALSWSSHFTGLNEEKCSCDSTQFGRIFPIPWGKSCNCCPRCLRMNFNWRIAYQASKPCLFELNSRENRANETLLNCLLSLWWFENWTRLLIFLLAFYFDIYILHFYIHLCHKKIWGMHLLCTFIRLNRSVQCLRNHNHYQPDFVKLTDHPHFSKQTIRNHWVK